MVNELTMSSVELRRVDEVQRDSAEEVLEGSTEESPVVASVLCCSHRSRWTLDLQRCSDLLHFELEPRARNPEDNDSLMEVMEHLCFGT